MDINEKNSFLKLLLHFCQNMVFSQKNWNSSRKSWAIPNIFFCFKGLSKSKLLSERIFYSWFLGWEKWNLLSSDHCFLRHVHQKIYKKSVIRNLKILSDEKLRTDVGFNLKPTRALDLVLGRSFVNSPEGQKWPINQLEIGSSTTYRAEIFTRSISH